MKVMKRIFAVVLMFTLAFSNVAVIKADAAEEPQNHFEQNLVENVEIDGVLYTFEHFLTEDGDKAVAITSEESGTDIVYYDEVAETVYMNEEIIATVETEIIEESIQIQPFAADWLLIGSYSQSTKWYTTTVAAVAAALSVVLPYAGTAGIIAAMGSAALSAIAGSASSGTVTGKYYKYNTNLIQSFKNVFSVKVGSKTYGSYTMVTTY